MPLFIKKARFSEEIIKDSDDILRRIDIRLPIAITKPSVSVPPRSPVIFEFVLDTGADYANVFPSQLLHSSIIPDASGGMVPLLLYDCSMIFVNMCDVTLWLYSNLKEFRNKPFRIDLNGGVVILPENQIQKKNSENDHNNSTRDNLPNPLLGMNALIDAGLKIELNAQSHRYSVWTPD